MSFDDKLLVLGSMSLRSQQYAGDYDGFEVVKRSGDIPKVVHQLASDFKDIIRRLQKIPEAYIGDIKCGVVPEWRVLSPKAHIAGKKVIGYNYDASVAVIEHLRTSAVIDAGEAKEALGLLKRSPTPQEFLNAKSELKFHIIRWTPEEILAGHTKLRDGRKVSLEDAIHSPGITKLDVIGLVQNNRYTDFSVIYEFYAGKTCLNPEPVDIATSLKESFLAYKAEGNYYKALKRQFALAKYENRLKEVARLTPIFNSDLGRLYSLTSDIKTLIDLLEFPGVPAEKVRFEIDQFIHRLSNIYSLKDVLKHEKQLLASIHHIVKLPLNKMSAPLQSLYDELDKLLQSNAKTLSGGSEPTPSMYYSHFPYKDAKGNWYNEGVAPGTGNKYKAYLNQSEKALRTLSHIREKEGDRLGAYADRSLADDLWEIQHESKLDAKHQFKRDRDAEQLFQHERDYYNDKYEKEVKALVYKPGGMFHNKPDGRRKALEHLKIFFPSQMFYYTSPSDNIITNPSKYADMERPKKEVEGYEDL
jgi:hypothetical protein